MSSAKLVVLTFLLLGITNFIHECRSIQDPERRSQLDESIRSYAFQRLAPLPKTGVIYNVTLPSTFHNVVTSVQAVRLRSGSLRRHGLVLNEFTIPVQSLVETTSKYVVLIYRSFNAGKAEYSIAGYTLVAPVLSIRSYEANDLNSSSRSSASEFNIFSGPTPVTVKFRSNRQQTQLQCAFFDKTGAFTLGNTSSSLTCALPQLVDSSLVIPSIAPAPAPAPVVSVASPAPVVAQGSAGVAPSRDFGRRRSSTRVWKLGIGLAVIGIGLIVVLGFLISWLLKSRHQAQIANMHYYADNSETLQTALIAGSRAPAAAATRTKPVLENDYVANV